MARAARPMLCSKRNPLTHAPRGVVAYQTATYHGSATTPAATSAVIGRIDQAVARKCPGAKGRVTVRRNRRAGEGAGAGALRYERVFRSFALSGYSGGGS